MKKASKQLLAVGSVLGLGLVMSTMPANAANPSTSTLKPAAEKPNTGKPGQVVDDKKKFTDIQVELKESNKGMTLNEAPKFTFPSFQVTTEKMEMNASAVTGKVQVSNPGLEGGYAVTAKISGFERAKRAGVTDPNDDLKGARLSLGVGKVTAENLDNASNAPKSMGVTLNYASQKVLDAERTDGLGTYNLTYQPEDVKLYLPDGAHTGSYSAQITWQFADAPK